MLEEPEAEREQQGGKAPSPTARIDLVNRTLTAMYVHKPLPVTYKDLTEAVGTHPTTVSLALSTARDLGLTKLSGKKGLYDFTPEGEDYCRNLTGKRIVECKSILKNTILKNPVWSNVINFLRSNENNPRDPIGLTIDIEKTLGKKWSEAMRTTVTDSLVSILEFSELARREGGKIVSLLGPGDGLQPLTPQRYGPIPATAPSIGRISDSDSYEFRDEGVYIKIRKDDRSIALAKDLVDLFARRHQSGLQTTKVEEAPGKN